MECQKPAHVSLVWEAGAQIEGVRSDMSQEGIEQKEQTLSLVIEDDYRARKKLMELGGNTFYIPRLRRAVKPREAELIPYTDKLLTQAKMNQEAYVSSQQALSTAEETVLQLQTQIQGGGVER